MIIVVTIITRRFYPSNKKWITIHKPAWCPTTPYLQNFDVWDFVSEFDHLLCFFVPWHHCETHFYFNICNAKENFHHLLPNFYEILTLLNNIYLPYLSIERQSGSHTKDCHLNVGSHVTMLHCVRHQNSNFFILANIYPEHWWSKM